MLDSRIIKMIQNKKQRAAPYAQSWTACFRRVLKSPDFCFSHRTTSYNTCLLLLGTRGNLADKHASKTKMKNRVINYRMFGCKNIGALNLHIRELATAVMRKSFITQIK